MGLDTTHDAWHGPYSSFHEWRVWIAKQIGMDLESMIGFGGSNMFDEEHPLTSLLSHSDCDGEISWQDCQKIADALQKILDGNPKEESEYDIENTKQFIEGCLLAAQEQEELEFG